MVNVTVTISESYFNLKLVKYYSYCILFSYSSNKLGYGLVEGKDNENVVIDKKWIIA